MLGAGSICAISSALGPGPAALTTTASPIFGSSPPFSPTIGLGKTGAACSETTTSVGFNLAAWTAAITPAKPSPNAAFNSRIWLSINVTAPSTWSFKPATCASTCALTAATSSPPCLTDNSTCLPSVTTSSRTALDSDNTLPETVSTLTTVRSILPNASV